MESLLSGVPQRLGLGLILFIIYIYINDLFLFLNEIDICNFSGDTTPFVCHKNLAELKETVTGGVL